MSGLGLAINFKHSANLQPNCRYSFAAIGVHHVSWRGAHERRAGMCLSKQFLHDESGAVTVDWVVLTSGVVVLAFLAVSPLIGPISDMAAYIRDTVFQASTFFE